ncbi:hypothetical protein BJX66DRAFT_293406 [Aspergillus keveii]|uniref:Uncharacterized protein n=1 Tax=Aspergillus keveii TaxID=714993 RepID=A0ABR4GJK7_9EURO
MVSCIKCPGPRLPPSLPLLDFSQPANLQSNPPQTALTLNNRTSDTLALQAGQDADYLPHSIKPNQTIHLQCALESGVGGSYGGPQGNIYFEVSTLGQVVQGGGGYQTVQTGETAYDILPNY